MKKIWFCKIGETEDADLQSGADAPMRDAVARAYQEITGADPDFIFSGWGGTLTKDERAVHDKARTLQGILDQNADPERELLREARDDLLSQIGFGTLASRNTEKLIKRIDALLAAPAVAEQPHVHLWRDKWQDGDCIGQACACGTERDVFAAGHREPVASPAAQPTVPYAQMPHHQLLCEFVPDLDAIVERARLERPELWEELRKRAVDRGDFEPFSYWQGCL